MTLPDNRIPPAGTGGTSEDDLLARGIESNSIADLALVADGAMETLTGLLLSSPSTETARGLLAELPLLATDPVLDWWLSGVRLCVAEQIIPNPLAAASCSIKAGLQTPPALRGMPVSEGWRLVAAATTVPMSCAGDLVSIVRDAHLRRAAQKAVDAMGAVVWRGELSDLAEVFQREAGAVVAQVVGNV